MADFSDLLESYYEEIDPDKRKKTLDEYLAAAGDSDPAAAYRKALYEYRFVDPADPQKKLDRFMLAFLDLDERVHTDPLFAEAFSLEVRNAARRYFDTCKTDGYHRKFFGIAASKPEEKEKQRCIDVWRMSYGLAERLDLEEEMDLFCRALSEAYRLSRVDGLTLTEAYRSYK